VLITWTRCDIGQIRDRAAAIWKRIARLTFKIAWIWAPSSHLHLALMLWLWVSEWVVNPAVVDRTQQGEKYDARDRTSNIQSRRRVCERVILDCQQVITQCSQRRSEVNFRSEALLLALLYEFEPKTLNERFLWNAWKQTKNRNKILEGKEFHDHGTWNGHTDVLTV